MVTSLPNQPRKSSCRFYEIVVFLVGAGLHLAVFFLDLGVRTFVFASVPASKSSKSSVSTGRHSPLQL